MLAAPEIYGGLTTERADRAAHTPTDAAAELRRLESQGVLDSKPSGAALVAAGHGEPEAAVVAVSESGRSLSSRGRHAAAGGPRPEDAGDRGTPAAAALWAMQNGMV